MCSKREAAKQINRLAALPGYIGIPAEGLQELTKYLQEYSDTDAHCERIITEWVRNARWMPVPADLEEMASRTRRSESRASQGAECARCKGTGFRPVHLLVTITRHPNGEVRGSEIAEIGPQVAHDLEAKLGNSESQKVAAGVGPCGCDYGRQLYVARMNAEAEHHDDRKRRSA